MSLGYVEESLSRVDEKTLQFKLVNNIGSGSANVGIKVLVDGRDLTTGSTLRRGSEDPRSVEPLMYITSKYGDDFLITVGSDTSLEPELHRIRVTCEIERSWTFSVEFEGVV